MSIVLIAALFWVSGADLATLKAEPDLEKRSDKALEFANRDLDEVRDDYRAGNIQQAKEALNEVREAVDLSYDSLKQTGKDPRKHPKHFKKAELKVRELLRRLRGLSDQASFLDRPAFDPVVKRLQEVHDELLSGIMGKKDE